MSNIFDPQNLSAHEILEVEEDATLEEIQNAYLKHISFLKVDAEMEKIRAAYLELYAKYHQNQLTEIDFAEFDFSEKFREKQKVSFNLVEDIIDIEILCLLK